MRSLGLGGLLSRDGALSGLQLLGALHSELGLLCRQQSCLKPTLDTVFPGYPNCPFSQSVLMTRAHHSGR